jgi:hypothetical protein
MTEAQRRWVRMLVLILGLVPLALSAGAAPLKPDEIPEPLRPWVDWVLWGHEQERCPFLHGAGDSRSCLWPSRLELFLDDSGGRFTQHWTVHGGEAWVPLPGEATRWPLEVRVDGQAKPVVDREGRPGLRLAEGRHRVGGVFRWDALPELLQVPPQSGLVRLVLRGQQVAFPERDARGRLWLQKRARKQGEQESRLEIEVHRRVADEVPLRLSTRIELKVSGESREVLLGKALPAEFIPMSLESPLPARLDPDGRLRVQVRPGRWQLVLEARHPGRADSLARPESGGPWDESEIWVFAARPHLRLVAVEDAVQVDPAQTTLPEDWKALPAYLMEPGRAMRLVEKRRGDSDPAPDALTLTRTWWLDFDGGGYTISDLMEGAIRRSTRLEMDVSIRLGRVAVNGSDQFITRREGSDAVGVEVPRGPIRLEADSRVEQAGSRLPAVGWMQDLQGLQGQLHLPPGWRLLHATGVDQASHSWVNRWTLLDLFLVLVITMAFYRLWGEGWGALALIGLALTYTEPRSPQWTWVAVAVGEALRRALPEGRLATAVRIYRGAAIAALLVVALPFLVAQARLGMHPALEWAEAAGHRAFEAPEPGRLQDDKAEAMFEQTEDLASPRALGVLAEEAPPPPAEAPVSRPPRPGRGGLSSSLYGYAPDPAARITTGPGLPGWQWRRVELRWSGPVEQGQQIRFLLQPPWLSGVLAGLRIALLAVLVLGVLGIPVARAGRWLRSGAGAAILLMALGLGASAGPARAEIPDPELLDQLRDRLLAEPECHPRCATLPRLALEVSPSRLRARLEVDVGAASGIPLPGGARGWTPETVLLDGEPAGALLRGSDGVLWVQLSPGVHQLLLEGRLPERESLELPLPLKPHRVEATVRGWELHGLHEDGLAEQSLQLTRVREQKDGHAEPMGARIMPPFVRVVRSIRMGITWQLLTDVQRLTPAEGAVLLEIPLLPGESVTSAGVRVKDGSALVSMAPGVRHLQWSSLLEEQGELLLTAPSQSGWTEVWRLDVNPIWHVEAKGIPVVHQPSPGGSRVREWRPWPAERVELSVSRPEGVEGRTLTVDASALELNPGLRATDAVLKLRLRSSRGGEHSISLPEGARLESASIDGALRPIRQEGRRVRIPLAPGRQQVELRWREPRGVGMRFRSSEVDLEMPGVNGEVRVAVPPSRWILLVGGPRLGPAVLFWPLLAVVALVALALARIPLTPLRFRHWLLLSVGLTQVPVAASAVVAAWLLALGWRRRSGAELGTHGFNLVQIALVAGAALAGAVLFISIQRGLLGLPEMQIAGNGSSASMLRWYLDRAEGALPRPWVLSVPLLVYRLAMLAWALWLAQALVGWLRWAWDCFGTGGLWRSAPIRWRRTTAPAEAGASREEEEA